MAINVNTVYQTVLLILNKEQRGYMTPVEFNKIGAQVQLEIFEKYFEDLNQQIRVPQTNVDYADRVASLDEKISIFKTSGNSAYTAGPPAFFSLPPTTTNGPITSTFGSTGATNYTIPNTTTSQTVQNPVVIVNGVTQTTGFSFTNNILTFTAAATPPASLVNIPTSGPSIGGGFTFFTATNAATLTIPTQSSVTGANTQGAPVVTNIDRTFNTLITLNVGQTYATGALLNFSNNITVTGTWVTPNESPVYKLGVVNVTNGALPTHELERVTRGELYHLLSSNLTKPTSHYPVYLYEKEQLIVYPTSINSGISCDFIKKPLVPSWNFTVGLQNQYLYNAATSVNFEIHESEQTELVLKILLYAGVVVKSMEIVQIAAQQVQQENNNQKS